MIVSDAEFSMAAVMLVSFADIRKWMITNKLKINDSKTEFFVFRSPQLKCDLSGLSVNVGEYIITQSSKVRDLGVIFDQFLNFDDHITVIIFCTMFQKVKLIDYKDFRINVRVS